MTQAQIDAENLWSQRFDNYIPPFASKAYPSGMMPANHDLNPPDSKRMLQMPKFEHSIVYSFNQY